MIVLQKQREREMFFALPQLQKRGQCHQSRREVSPQSAHDKNVHCHCCCVCGKTIKEDDPIVRKRQKRKQCKKKQKQRHKEQKEKTIQNFEQIVKDIYALQITYDDISIKIEQYFQQQSSRNKFQDFINIAIREEVDIIRTQMVRYLKTAAVQLDSIRQDQMVRQFFKLIHRIKKASPQIQKIIDLFVSLHYDTQILRPSIQNRLDHMTLRFIIKNDLQNSVNDVYFSYLCGKVFDEQQFHTERQLINYMMNAYQQTNSEYGQVNEGDDDSSESSYQSSSQGDQQYENVEISTLESLDGGQSKSKRRRERKKRMKEEFESSFEAILKRVSNMKIIEEERIICNVSEEWAQRMLQKREAYRKEKFQ